MPMPAIFARDSWLWAVLYYVGIVLQVIISGITLDVMAHPEGLHAGLMTWGIPDMLWKWLSLVNPLVTAFAGKQGMSNVPLQRNLNGGGK